MASGPDEMWKVGVTVPVSAVHEILALAEEELRVASPRLSATSASLNRQDSPRAHSRRSGAILPLGSDGPWRAD